MNPHTIKRLFPNASQATIAANAQDYGKPHVDSAGTIAKLEHYTFTRSLAEGEVEKADTRRVHIRFISVRQLLCDPDNLCEKFLLDCLRNCGAIIGDEPDKITLETTQRKAAKGEEEHTQITITYP